MGISDYNRVVSFGGLNLRDGNGYTAALLKSFAQPGDGLSAVQRGRQAPVVTAINQTVYTLPVLQIEIEDDPTLHGARVAALMAALDTSNGAKALVIADIDPGWEGDSARYLMVNVQAVDQIDNGGGWAFAVTLVATNDNRWRLVQETSRNYTWTASAATTVFNNAGELEVWPEITITPQTGKSTAGYTYKRHVIMAWQSPYPSAKYHPVELTDGTGLDTVALLAAGKITTSEDIRVVYRGKIIPHWYGADDGVAGGFNHTATKIWVNADFDAGYTIRLAEVIPLGSTKTTWKLWAKALPNEGRLLFTDTGEIITYKGFTPQTANGNPGIIYNVERGEYGTTENGHTMTEPINARTRLFDIVYGPSAGAGFVATEEYNRDNARVPIIDKADSTNTEWVYDAMFRNRTIWYTDPYVSNYEDNSGGWAYFGNNTRGLYTHPTDATGTVYGTSESWTAMGFRAQPTPAATNTNGQYYAGPFPVINRIQATARHKRFGAANPNLFNYPVLFVHNAPHGTVPGQPNAFTIWQSAVQAVATSNSLVAIDESITSDDISNPRYIEFSVDGATNTVQADIQSMTVTFASDRAPYTAVMSAEDSDYDMALKLENVTTGEYLNITMPNMKVGEDFVIDCEAGTVRHNNVNQYQAVVPNAPRPYAFKLAAGNNTIKVTETGLTDVDIFMRFQTRWYT